MIYFERTNERADELDLLHSLVRRQGHLCVQEQGLQPHRLDDDDDYHFGLSRQEEKGITLVKFIHFLMKK